jgi:hypothetical protein
MQRHSPGRATSPRGWASAANRAMLSAMWNAPNGLRRCTPWLWIYCERCQHRSPAAVVPLIVWSTMRWRARLACRTSR